MSKLWETKLLLQKQKCSPAALSHYNQNKSDFCFPGQLCVEALFWAHRKNEYLRKKKSLVTAVPLERLGRDGGSDLEGPAQAVNFKLSRGCQLLGLNGATFGQPYGFF
jgi:hypothetical protein